jgi:TRAP-type C4-dicarboxylate transport system permease small subunit
MPRASGYLGLISNGDFEVGVMNSLVANLPNNIEPDRWETDFGRLLRKTAFAITVFIAVLVCTTLFVLLLHTGFDFWKDILHDHFMGTAGLIGIWVTAFGIVTFLRQSEGPIEFEALGMKFKGGAGQVIMWSIAIVVLSLCAKLLW